MTVRSVQACRRVAFVSCAFASLGLLAAAPASGQTADLVFINGKVFTADDRSAIAEAFAVKDGRFIAVGTTAAMRAHAGPGAKVVDLNGCFVTPGLADAHLHNEGGGRGIDLSGTRSLAELFAVVGRAAKDAAPGTLIISNNDWHEAQLKEQRLPTAQELDHYAPANPVVLIRGGHEYILNSAAFRHWNITKATASPAGGEIGKDAGGELNGVLVDNAKALVTLPPAGNAVTVDDVLTTQHKLNSHGITSVRVPGNYKGDFYQGLNAMLEARKTGALTMRFNMYLPGSGVRDIERMRAIVAQSPLKQDEGDEWVRVGGVKLGLDGGFEGGLMTKPFLGEIGRNGTYFGINRVPAAPFNAIVKMLNAGGWRVTTHAVGDAAVDQVLDAYEAANAERPLAGRRWGVEHLFVTRPDQVARLKKLDLVLSVQNHLYLAAPSLKNYLGMDRASQITPVKTYLDTGLLVVGGTDSPVVPFNPFWEFYHFLTRNTITDGVYGANERVTSRVDLLRMITINVATYTGEAAIKGSIEPGKLADFAVLSEDMLTAPEQRLVDMKALATYVGGKEVYRDPSYQ